MINIPKGTKDVLPSESYKWQYIEELVRDTARRFAVNEIRTPVFEHTELFLRGVGETTDIVSKEMYTFLDKGNRSITLKPEGTAGVARSFVENSLISLPQPIKTFYITPVFRYERPQSGRLREHHQFGVEFFGSYTADTDVEIMMLAKTIFDRLGIENIKLNINSIGCRECRKTYNTALKNYLAEHINEMCPTCKERFEKNPLRILDCKEEKCKAINADAPIILDYLCDDCSAHHARVVERLTSLNVDFSVNPRIVRGLDYYTQTVFEFISENIGAQGTVCGGGRYNHLVEEVGGKECPAVGFGMGIERLLLTLENLGLSTGEERVPDLYIAPICDVARDKVLPLAMELRQTGYSVEYDLIGRSLKAQMKYAGKIKAKFVAVIGDDEIAKSVCSLKRMSDGYTETVKLASLADDLIRLDDDI